MGWSDWESVCAVDGWSIERRVNVYRVFSSRTLLGVELRAKCVHDVAHSAIEDIGPEEIRCRCELAERVLSTLRHLCAFYNGMLVRVKSDAGPPPQAFGPTTLGIGLER